MKRTWLAIALTWMLCMISMQSGAVTRYVEGVHYLTVSGEESEAPSDKVELMEFFSYSCPHCYALEPHIDHWYQQQDDKVVLNRVPGMFRASWKTHAQVYYTAEALGVLDKTHTDFFKAVHQERRPMLSEQEISDFFGQRGVDEKDFNAMYSSFGIHSKLTQAAELAKKYRITSVPTFVINRKYISHAGLVGSQEELVNVIDYLVKKEQSSLSQQ